MARSAALAAVALAAVAVLGPSSGPVDAEREQVAAPAPPTTTTTVPSTSAAPVPTRFAKVASVSPSKAPLVLPEFAPVVGSLAPRIRAGYELAAGKAAELWPDCGVRWTMLAGIGSIESANGAHHDGAIVVSGSGAVLPHILGPRLDGRDGRSLIGDTDGGALDGDVFVDRAVGPMQFIPSTWKRHGRDANGDGVADPHSIDDASLSAAGYLCVAGDLRDEETLRRALYSYNHSDDYVAVVRDQIARFDVEFGFVALPPATAAPTTSVAPTSAPPTSTTTSVPATAPPTSEPVVVTTTTRPPTTVAPSTTTAAPSTTTTTTTTAPTTTVIAEVPSTSAAA